MRPLILVTVTSIALLTACNPSSQGHRNHDADLIGIWAADSLVDFQKMKNISPEDYHDSISFNLDATVIEFRGKDRSRSTWYTKGDSIYCYNTKERKPYVCHYSISNSQLIMISSDEPNTLAYFHKF